ncbi:ABC transporter ATP-binding protein [Fusibacter ferrireducens]|uniref:ABC transporter ATP-binding protein n=1 Tax=Fusibacter ferrireducens TaxID=2785058 RepID=A0ABR9ZQP8_9FIRM|nr:ABC transporter ATP-binding protein [Fusibacter ferrireducens]MBF4692771.1 ABC transporter ATP-binding protein [Fusibacter ferrireducens]
MESILVAKNLSKTYQMGEVTVSALRDVNFEIYDGEFVVVLGPSGSGKSTMLNMIGGMDQASEGEIYFRGKALHNATDKTLTQFRRNAIGFVFQFYNLIPNLTAYENVKLSVELSKDPLDIEMVLNEVELLDRSDHFPSQLSGGQQQRVAIARAIAKNPDILLCDEPTGALDFSTGLSVLNLLKKFNKTYKKTVVIITHNAGIGKIGDRVFYIKDGQIEKVVVNDKPLAPEEVTW